jgi:hypothetical protein
MYLRFVFSIPRRTVVMPVAVASLPTRQLANRGTSSPYCWTPLPALTLPTAPAVDVYASTPGTEPKLLWHSHKRLGDDHLAEIRRSGAHFAFWVERADYRRVADAVRENWTTIAANKQLFSCDRFALCELAYELELSATQALKRPDPYVTMAKCVGAEAARILSEQPVSSRLLFETIRHGNGSASRQMQIAGYAVQLARLTGIVELASLKAIATAAILHDIGARDVPVNVWSNPARWSPDERELVERHPQQSYEILLACGGLSQAQLLMAYQHHERMDGSGFPVGIMGDEIHPWSRMLAVADRFQALTSGRCFRLPLALPETLDQLAQDAGNYLDEEMTQCWIKSLTTT